MILLVKLALAKFSIEITVVSNATVGALIAAKAALILDETSLARRLERLRRIVAVCVKTAIYGSATLMLGYIERYVEALHRTRSMAGAFGDILTHANHYLLVAWALGVSIVFAAYFSIFEISQQMGPGELMRLFFDLPEARESSKESKRDER